MTDISLRYLLFGDDRSASSAIEGTGATAQKTSSIVHDAFSKIGESIGGWVGEGVSAVDSALSTLGDHTTTFGEKMAGAGVGVAGLGAGLSMLGSNEKEASNAIKSAIGSSGKSYDDYKGKIEETIKQQENFGHSAVDTQNALAALTTETKDPAAAISHMGLVANLAAAQHISLQDAAVQVGKALNGSTRVFKTYGIQVASTSSAQASLTKAQDASAVASKASSAAHAQLNRVQHAIAIGALSGKAATDDLAAAQANVTSADGKAVTAHDALTKAQTAMHNATHSTTAGFDELSKRLDGQAAGSVDSFTGHLHVLETKAHDIVSAFGAKFGTTIQAAGVGLALLGTVTQILANRQVIQAAATEAATVATTEEAVATDVAATSTGVLGAAMDALPIFALIAGIALLVGGIILAYKHSATFRAIVQGAFRAVEVAGKALGAEFMGLWKIAEKAFTGTISVISAVVTWVKSHWPLLLAILTGPIGLATLFIVSHWQQITQGAANVVSGIKSGFNTVVQFVSGLPARIGNATVGMFDGIKNAFRAAINWIISTWNNLSFTLPSVNTHIPGVGTVGGMTISTPNIPLLARGGTTMTRGIVTVGERGTEQLMLPAGASVRPLSASERRGAGGDLGTVTIVVRNEDAKVLQTKLLRLKRDNGNLSLGLA